MSSYCLLVKLNSSKLLFKFPNRIINYSYSLNRNIYQLNRQEKVNLTCKLQVTNNNNNIYLLNYFSKRTIFRRHLFGHIIKNDPFGKNNFPIHQFILQLLLISWVLNFFLDIGAILDRFLPKFITDPWKKHIYEPFYKFMNFYISPQDPEAHNELEKIMGKKESSD